MQSNKTIHFLNYLRIFSCLLIVTVHIAANQFYAVSTHSFSWQCMNFYDCFALLGVPLFVMISGTVMLSTHKSASILYMLKKAGKLYLLYYIWGFFYNCINYFLNSTFTFSSFKAEVLYNTLAGGMNYHLWFIPMLIGLYLMTPILKNICISKKLLEYSLLLYLIFALFFPTIFLYNFPYRTIVQATFTRLNFTYIGQYLGYYLLGYYLYHYTNNWNKIRYAILTIGSILCFLAIVFLCGYDGYIKNEASTIVNTPLTFFHLTTCSGIFLLFKNKFNKVTIVTSLTNKITKLTLGIYLIHPLIIIFMNTIGITTLTFMPLFSIPILAIGVFVVSALFILILSKIPILRHLI